MVKDLVVKKRRPINKKEAKLINEGIIYSHGINISAKAGEYEKGISENFDVIILGGNIIALIMDDKIHLTVRGLLIHPVNRAWVQVDLGAVPFVCNGANVMSAGINSVSPEIVKGQYVWIREENHHKPLGIGRTIIDAETMLNSQKGKAVKLIHHIGDRVWEFGEKR